MATNLFSAFPNETDAEDQIAAGTATISSDDPVAIVEAAEAAQAQGVTDMMATATRVTRTRDRSPEFEQKLRERRELREQQRQEKIRLRDAERATARTAREQQQQELARQRGESRQRRDTFCKELDSKTFTATVPDFETENGELAAKIAGNMWLVHVKIKRPTGSFKITGAQVVAEKKVVGKTTKPGYVVDEPTDHEAWAEIDELARRIDGTVAMFSVNDKSRKGFHLVPAGKLAALYKEVRTLRRARLDAVQKLRDGHRVWLDNLKVKYPNHFHLLEPLLPAPHQLMEKFDVHIIAEELTPISGDRLRFEDINDSDKSAICEEANRMARRMINERAQSIYEEVFGKMIIECKAITAGAMKTGVRKMGGITALIDNIERMKNFREFIPGTEFITHADEALSQLRQISDIDDVNANYGDNAVSAAITAAFKPLGESLEKAMKELTPGGGKARRRLR